MTADTKITCDACGNDLTYTGNSVDYRLVLANQAKTPWYVEKGETCGPVTDMMIYPPVSKTMHFCRLACLKEWVNRDGT